MRKPFSLLIPLFLFASFAGQAQDADGGTAYEVDSDASWLRVLAYPDGPLRRFGHHHVISHHDISGIVRVAPNPLESSISLQINVSDLVVDDPALRALEGENFEKEVSEKDVNGTRANMLGEDLLHGAQFPGIRIESGKIEGSLADATIVATVTVKGMEQIVRFPASIELTDDAFVARGQVELTHEALGLSPFTAAGGALRVRDLLVFKYEIAGAPAQDGSVE